MAVKGFTGENTGPKPWAGETEKERNEVRQRELEDGKKQRQNNSWIIKQYFTEEKLFSYALPKAIKSNNLKLFIRKLQRWHKAPIFGS